MSRYYSYYERPVAYSVQYKRKGDYDREYKYYGRDSNRKAFVKARNLVSKGYDVIVSRYVDDKITNQWEYDKKNHTKSLKF